MNSYFEFEQDFIRTLRCIPMAVRLKLDTCGIKLDLKQWLKFSENQRQEMTDMPCTNKVETQIYKQHLSSIIEQFPGQKPHFFDPFENPPWDNLDQIPLDLKNKMETSGITSAISPEQWRSLSRLQRFALCKLSRPNHESKNFLPALQEFGLLPKVRLF